MTQYPSQQSLVAMIRRVSSGRGRAQAGLYSIEGVRLVERALRAATPPDAVLIAERFAASPDPRHRQLLAELEANAQIVTASDDVMDNLTEGRDLGPIIGLVRLPKPVTLAEILANAAGQPAFLAAVEVVDPGNVGALTRTAHVSGASALLSVGASDPYHPRAVRISRGSLFKLPVIQFRTVHELLADLRRENIAAVATAASGGTPLHQISWPKGAIAVLMGNEAEGLPSDVRSALDLVTTIPMSAGVDSYSVNAAAAILLYALAQARNRAD
jgi:TrmH family RNA methyltransferase